MVVEVTITVEVTLVADYIKDRYGGRAHQSGGCHQSSGGRQGSDGYYGVQQKPRRRPEEQKSWPEVASSAVSLFVFGLVGFDKYTIRHQDQNIYSDTEARCLV